MGSKFQEKNELQPSINWLDPFQSVAISKKRKVTKRIPKTQVRSCHLNVLVCPQRSWLRRVSSWSRTAGSGPYCSGLSYYDGDYFSKFPGRAELPPEAAPAGSFLRHVSGKGQCCGYLHT